MSEIEASEIDTLPRWATISIGLLLIPFTFFCVAGSVIILLAPNVPPSAFTVSIGSLFLAGSLWAFYLSFRLVFVNPKNSKGFISPLGLRAAALVFVAIPIASVLTGTFWQKPFLYGGLAVGYAGIVCKLLYLAKKRSKNA